MRLCSMSAFSWVHLYTCTWPSVSSRYTCTHALGQASPHGTAVHMHLAKRHLKVQLHTYTWPSITSRYTCTHTTGQALLQGTPVYMHLAKRHLKVHLYTCTWPSVSSWYTSTHASWCQTSPQDTPSQESFKGTPVHMHLAKRLLKVHLYTCTWLKVYSRYTYTHALCQTSPKIHLNIYT